MCATQNSHLSKLQRSYTTMDQKTLARELVRARLAELVKMKAMIEKMHSSLEKMLAVQMKFQELIEEDEERGYELQAGLDDEDTDRDSALSFGVLLEIAVNRLKG
ncbi:hypothetical protein F442_16837 [Phytophthora nicotianae P10297]|uniref:Uncharacterized protein n=2 Tax=Phytophthora nicotianae TaxID=4792 RepID=W2YJ15_PHYNI|nr:hypothetical protein F442_16837 [Phytophthora nicotianae P10297]